MPRTFARVLQLRNNFSLSLSLSLSLFLSLYIPSSFITLPISLLHSLMCLLFDHIFTHSRIYVKLWLQIRNFNCRFEIIHTNKCNPKHDFQITACNDPLYFYKACLELLLDCVFGLDGV